MGVGSINEQLKMIKFQMKWAERKKDPFKQKDKEQNPMINHLIEISESMQKSNTISSIDIKLRSGKRLTPEEMEYLKANSPDLYKKALEVEKQREEYRRELKQCRNEEDVKRLKARTCQTFLVRGQQLTTSSSGYRVCERDTFMMVRAAITDEHYRYLSENPHLLPKANKIDTYIKKDNYAYIPIKYLKYKKKTSGH